jgi:hypothetical protein
MAMKNPGKEEAHGQYTSGRKDAQARVLVVNHSGKNYPSKYHWTRCFHQLTCSCKYTHHLILSHAHDTNSKLVINTFLREKQGHPRYHISGNQIIR